MGFFINLLIGLALNLLAKVIAPKSKNGYLTGVDLGPQAGPDVPRQILLGTTGLFGQIIYHNSHGSNNEFHEQVFLLSDWRHPGGISAVWVDGKRKVCTPAVSSGPWTKYSIEGWDTSEIILWFYNGSQTTGDANPDLITKANPTGKWDSNSIAEGLSYVIAFYRYVPDSDVYKGGGLPQMKFELQGAVLYDWRKDSTNGGTGAHRWDDVDTWEYTDNPAVALYNYMRGFYISGKRLIGMGVEPERILLSTFTAAANACDELVPLSGGGNEKRYRLSMTVTSDKNTNHAAHLDALLAPMAGYLYDYAGLYCVGAGVPQIPVATITDKDLLVTETIAFADKRPSSELTNAIYGTFLSAEQGWEGISYTPQTSVDGIAADGEELAVTLDLASVPSQFQAQRIARIRLLEARHQRSANINLGLKWLRLQAGDWITWNSDRFGNHEYRIVNRQVDYDRGVINLELAEISSEAYDWDGEVDEGPSIPVPVVLLPGTQITTVSSFAATAVIIDNDGVPTPVIYFTYTPIDDPSVVQVEIQYKVSTAADSEATKIFDTTPSDGGTAVTEELSNPGNWVARARLDTVPPRSTPWTSWVPVTESPGYTSAVNDLTLARLGVQIAALLQRVDEQLPGDLQTLRQDLMTLAGAVATQGTFVQDQLGFIRTAVGSRYEENLAGIETVAAALATSDSAIAQLLVDLFAVNEVGEAIVHFRAIATAQPEGALASVALQLRAGRSETDEWAEAALEMIAYYDAELGTYSRVRLVGDKVDFVVGGQVLPAHLLAIPDTPQQVPINSGDVTVDLSLRRVSYKTFVDAACEVQFPTGIDRAGQGYRHIFEQDTGGGNAVTFAAEFIGTAPTIESGGNNVTIVDIHILSIDPPLAIATRWNAVALPGGSLPADGVADFTAPGVQPFVVPVHNQIIIEVWGPGGGGGGGGDFSGFQAGSGLASYFGSAADLSSGRVPARLVGNPGLGGYGNKHWPNPRLGGPGGTATGGNTYNTSGVVGAPASSFGSTSGAGGAGATDAQGPGGPGGAAVGPSNAVGKAGTAPGGGGSGGKGTSGAGGGGGGGGKATSIYLTGTLIPGTTIDVFVGTGGSAGNGNWMGAKGANGRVRISWT